MKKYFSFKLATVKVCAVCVGVCLLFGALCLTGSFSALGADVFSVSAKVTDGETNESRLKFLNDRGYVADETPVLSKEISVPKVFDAVYARYNEEIQRKSGYDLRKFAGKQVMLYSYRITNYPDEVDVTANLLVFEGRIIGGDICSARLDGFMHGLNHKNENTPTVRSVFHSEALSAFKGTVQAVRDRPHFFGGNL